MRIGLEPNGYPAQTYLGKELLSRNQASKIKIDPSDGQMQVEQTARGCFFFVRSSIELDALILDASMVYGLNFYSNDKCVKCRMSTSTVEEGIDASGF